VNEKVLVLLGAGLCSLFSWYLTRRLRQPQELPSTGEKLSLYAGIFLLTVSLAFGIHEYYTKQAAAPAEKKLQKYQKEPSGCAGEPQRLKPLKKEP